MAFTATEVRNVIRYAEEACGVKLEFMGKISTKRCPAAPEWRQILRNVRKARLDIPRDGGVDVLRMKCKRAPMLARP